MGGFAYKPMRYSKPCSHYAFVCQNQRWKLKNVCFVANLDVDAECEESLVNTNLDLTRPKKITDWFFLAQVT